MSTPSSALTPAAPTEAVEDVELKTDTRPVIRLGFWTLVVGFGAFLAWAAWAPLDEGVIAPSTVTVESRRKTIQHLHGGVIRELKVREGQEVKEGDVLIVLDDAATRAGYESIRQNYLAQRAHESRLTAEIVGAPSITFHEDLKDASDPIVAQNIAVQQRLFAARRAAQNAEIAAGEQAIEGLQGQMSGMRTMLENRRQQQEIQSRQLVSVRSLADDGFAPRNQALQLEQAQVELRNGIAEIETTLQRISSSVAETRLRIAKSQQDYLKEVSSQLAEVRREVQANQERLVAATRELGRTQITSPVSGQVIGVAISGPGGVVTPGQRLMDVLPRNVGLILDARIPPQVIDRIKVGDEVEVRFSTFADAPQLVVYGKLVSLSGDAITEVVGNVPMSHYIGRIELTEEGMKALGNRTIQPGMMAEALIRTGERSLLTYLMHPLTKRVAASMTEE